MQKKVKLNRKKRMFFKQKRQLVHYVLIVVGFALIIGNFKAKINSNAATIPEPSQMSEIEQVQTEPETEKEYIVVEKETETQPPTEEPILESKKEWDYNTEYLLAKIAMAEAEGEDIKGKALVINVILNRVNDTTFPNTVSEVIFQENQFSPVSNGRFDNVEPNEDCWKALEMVKQGYDESNGALYFSSNMSSDSWHNIALSLLFVYGNHQFYK